jgi:hypothetical protein
LTFPAHPSIIKFSLYRREFEGWGSFVVHGSGQTIRAGQVAKEYMRKNR